MTFPTLSTSGESIAGDRLGDWVRADFGLDLVSFERVGHGADVNAELWRGWTTDEVSYAIKSSGGGTSAGLLVSQHLADQGVPGIVAPLPSAAGEPWSVRQGRRLSVLPWVSDHRAPAGGMTEEHWKSYGALLARLHSAPVSDRLAELVPKESHNHEQVASAAEALDRRLRQLERPGDRPDESGRVGVVRPRTGQPDDRDRAVDLTADRLVRALFEVWPAAAGSVWMLLKQADRLAAQIRRTDPPRVICHGDPHLGNLLLGDDGQVWLIDWDDAVIAPRELDLMFVIGGGVLAFAPVGEADEASFLAGYGPADVDRVRLAYYLCVRALWDLVDWAAQVVDVERFPEPDRMNALEIVQGLLSANGLVTIALNSLRGLGVMSG